MKDIDVTTNIDPVTGIPRIDERSTATRWLACLHHGLEFHGTKNGFLAPSSISDAVGDGQTKQNNSAEPATAEN